MGRILVFGFPAHGHVNPTLAVVAGLVARGHDVDYLTARPFIEAVEATGAQARLHRDPFLAGTSGIDAATFPAMAPALLFESTLAVLDQELPWIVERGHDAVFFDSLAPWGPIVARRIDAPAIASISTFALHPRMARMARGFERPGLARIRMKMKAIGRARRARRELARRHGTRGPSWFEIYCNRGDISLVYTSRQFQPFAERLDPSHRFVGPSLRPPARVDDFPFERLDPARRTVFVSLGTSFQDDLDFYRTAIDALSSDESVQTVVSTGGMDVEPLGPVADTVIIRPFVPQVELLGRVDLFISRGGMNSVSEALWHGVPLVTVPFLAEQAVVGRRVEQLGAGVVLRRKDVDRTSLLRSARDILADPGYKAAARQVGKGLQRAGGPERAADEIESMLSSPRWRTKPRG